MKSFANLSDFLLNFKKRMNDDSITTTELDEYIKKYGSKRQSIVRQVLKLSKYTYSFAWANMYGIRSSQIVVVKHQTSILADEEKRVLLLSVDRFKHDLENIVTEKNMSNQDKNNLKTLTRLGQKVEDL